MAIIEGIQGFSVGRREGGKGSRLFGLVKGRNDTRTN